MRELLRSLRCKNSDQRVEVWADATPAGTTYEVLPPRPAKREILTTESLAHDRAEELAGYGPPAKTKR